MRKNLYTVKYTLLRKGFQNRIVKGAILADSQEIAVREGRKVVEDSLQNIDGKTEIKLLSVSKAENDFFIVAQAEK